ncbi:MAG: hypothetical protein CFE24_04465 [Flavobacterium sp. BFFFF2]|nr:MAG: hypothetical protein CFE24_04465 [Flavobacterium sp. BFFFF2]
MKKQLPIYLYGSIIILVGVFLLISEHNPFQKIKLIVGISLIVGAVFAFISAFARQRQQVQFAYHEMHALAMLVYGIALFLFCHSMESLTSITAFLFFFYAFSEILFCNWLFNLAQKVVFRIVLVRVVLGLAIGVGTVFAMNDSAFPLQIFGILFIMVGINILFYVPVMKAKLK